MIVQIQIRSVYGEDKAYPVGQIACGLAAIAGTKTITQHTLREALAMGMTLQVVDRYGQVSRTYEPGDWKTRSNAINALAVR